MSTTANRGYTYPASTDNANLWTHFQNLAEDVDTDVQGIVDDLDAMAPVQYDSSDNNASPISVTTSTAKGTTTCGGTFVAPPSGSVMVTFNGVFQAAAGTGWCLMGAEIRSGSTVGSGTVAWTPTTDVGGKCGTNSTDLFAGGCTRLVTGLTPGATYNVTAVFFAVGPSGLTISYFARSVAVYPVH